MDSLLYKRIQAALNEELIRRLLVKYFVEAKDIQKDQLDKNIYPPMLQDLTMRIPQFSDKMEIEAAVKDFDPQSGRTHLTWNLFVLGNQRMNLGESNHENLAELKQASFGPSNNKSAVRSASPKKIIEFIIKVLGSSDAGIIDPKAKPASVGGPPQSGPGGSSKFYAGSQGFEQNRPVL